MSEIPPVQRLRSPFLYVGGKGRMVAKLLPRLPNGRIYVEPFAGAANLLFYKEPHPVEVLNDIDEMIVNFFRVLQNRETFEELRHRIMYTPYSRAELERAISLKDSNDPVDLAWSWFVRQNQGISGRANSFSHWGRAFTSNSGISDNINSWLMRQAMLDAFANRLKLVQIERRDGIECIRYWDREDTVFYVDPPYILGTRPGGKEYTYETTEDYHANLVATLLGVKGKVLMSCYWHPIYTDLVKAGWKREDFKTVAYSANATRRTGMLGYGGRRKKAARTEVLLLKE